MFESFKGCSDSFRFDRYLFRHLVLLLSLIFFCLFLAHLLIVPFALYFIVCFFVVARFWLNCSFDCFYFSRFLLFVVPICYFRLAFVRFCVLRLIIVVPSACFVFCSSWGLAAYLIACRFICMPVSLLACLFSCLFLCVCDFCVNALRVSRAVTRLTVYRPQRVYDFSALMSGFWTR